MTDPQNPQPPQGPQGPPGPQPPPMPPAQPGYPQQGPQGYPPPAGGPPPGYGAPPQPKKSRTGLIIGLAVGIPLALIAVVVVIVILFVNSVSGPADATNEFLAALKSGDTAAIKSVSCNELITSGELDSLDSQLEALEPTRGTIESYNISSSSIENSTGKASGTLTFTKGVTKTVDAQLVQEDGKWKVCSIQER